MINKPPFEINDNILELVSKIMENLGSLNSINDLEKFPRLRKVSRLKSIQSSLAIEQNSLNIDEVNDVINGKKIIGKEDDILAVKNAYKAYELIDTLDLYSLNDLLKAHSIMMNNLTNEVGQIRSKEVGVADENGNIIHMAPSSKFVHQNINNLFEWIKETSTNFLIKSCVFHYEFEFIHPFNDGNGRMGRLWQTVILSSYKPIFKYIPIESIIKDNQQRYYDAINKANNNGDSTIFIEFMLECINDALKDIIKDTRKHYNHISKQINDLLNVIEYYPMSAEELMVKLNLKSRNSFRDNYIKPAIEAGLIKMTLPDKPTSKNQKYYKI